MNRLFSVLCIALIASFAMSMPAYADAVWGTWTYGGVDTNFYNPANWSPNLDGVSDNWLRVDDNSVNSPVINTANPWTVMNFWVGSIYADPSFGSPTTTAGKVTVQDGGTLNVNWPFDVGCGPVSGGTSSIVMTGGVINHNSDYQVRFGINGGDAALTMSGTSQFNKIYGGELLLGVNDASAPSASVAVATLSDSAFLYTSGHYRIGDTASFGGTGAVTATGSILMSGKSHVQNWNRQIVLGNGVAANGTISLVGDGLVNGEQPVFENVGSDCYSWIGASGGTALLYVENAAYTDNGEMHVGEAGGANGTLTLVTTPGSMNQATVTTGGYGFHAGSSATGNINVNANTKLQANVVEAFIGRFAGGVGNLNIDGGTVAGIAYANLGRDGGIANITMTNGASMTVGAEYRLGCWGGTGTLNMTDSTISSDNFRVGSIDHGSASANLMGSSNVTTREFQVGGDGGTGNMTIGASSTVTVTSGWASVGNGTLGGSGTVTSSGTVSIGSPLFIGRSGGTGSWTQTGGSLTVTDRTFLGEYVSDAAPGVGTLDLTGTTLSTWGIAYSAWTNSPEAGHGNAQTVNIDNSTIVCNATWTNVTDFINPKGAADFNMYILSGGAVFDTNGKNCDVRTGLKTHAASLGGGLTKTGTGTLALYAPSTYTGNTSVNVGTLAVTGAGSLASPNITVNPAATLYAGTNVSPRFDLSSLILNSGSTLKLALTGTAADTTNAVNVTKGGAGVLDLASGFGTTTLYVTSDSLARTFPLDTTAPYTVANYSTVVGSVANLNVASNYRATFVPTVGSGTVKVQITPAAADITWNNGLFSSVWNVAADANWVFTSGTPTGQTAFYDLDTARFGDTGAGNVLIDGQVHPLDVYVNNSLGADYSFVDNLGTTGGIVGLGTTLTKDGAGKLTLTNTGGNTFTGNVAVNAGTVEINRNDQLGQSNTISVAAGATLTALHQWTIANSTLETAGTVTLPNGLRLGPDGGNATLKITAGTVTTGAAWSDAGYGGQATIIMTGGTFDVNGTAGIEMGTNQTDPAKGAVVDLSGSAIFNVTGTEFRLGASGNGKLTMSDNTQLNVQQFNLAPWGNFNSPSSALLKGHAAVTATSMTIGGQNTKGVLTVSENASAQVNGDLQVGFWGGVDGTENGIVVDAGATGTASLTVTGTTNVGWQWGGNPTSERGNQYVTISGAGATATINSLNIGAQAGQGAWNQNGGSTTVANQVILGQYDLGGPNGWPEGSAPGGSLAALNLNGGTFAAPSFTTDASPDTEHAPAWGGNARGTVNFNGGTLQLTAPSTNLFATAGLDALVTLNVLAGGADIDVNGNAVTITQALTGDAADRSLAVSSSTAPGTLTLTGAVSNIGPVSIDSDATLQMNNGATTFTTVTGAGSMHVVDGSTVTATSIVLDTLVIGGPAAAAAASPAAVPEPGTFVLLALAGLGALLAWRRK